MTDVYSIIFATLPLNWQSYRLSTLDLDGTAIYWHANPNSLQFDPAPRAGEPMVSRRVPDYFLVRGRIQFILHPCSLLQGVCLYLEFFINFYAYSDWLLSADRWAEISPRLSC